MKYEAELGNVRGLLPSVRSVLIALSSNPTIDDLAAGLALYLSLKQAGKDVSIVTEGSILVGHTNLFGVGNITNKLPEGKGGDFSIVLSGVATPDGKVTAVEKMDYFTTGSDLNLVFKVFPGQKFEPTAITPKTAGGNFDLIFVIGAKTLSDLGGIYTAKPEIFSAAHIIDIDNKGDNSRFGNTSIVDSASSSVSEIVGEVLMSLQLPLETDIASNVLSGIFNATNNLQGTNTTADTFAVVAEALKKGGQKPNFNESQPKQPDFQQAFSVNPVSSPQPAPQPVAPQPQEGEIDLSKIFNAPVNISTSDGTVQDQKQESFTVPPVVSSGIEQKPFDTAQNKPEIPQPSAEETPSGEGIESENPEADWLTPKIFRGKGG